jgi:YYY domain-containing protein
MPEILLWGATVELLGLAALPILRVAFAGRRDAALLSRLTGLALVAWGGWALSLLPSVPFERRTLLIAGLAVAAVSWLVARKSRAARSEYSIGPFWGREETRAALYFWIPTAVFLLIRACLPDILGQEKFMDLAFLNSLVRNREMPPLDPWMSGPTINYYYWGYLLAAALVRLAGVVVSAGYNMAIATFAGYSFSAAACVGFRLSGGRARAAIASGFAAVFAGDVAGAFDAMKAPLGKGFDYWHASRVIGDGKTINEFPFFTFFQADLHPHLLAFPYFLAAFALGSRLLEIPARPPGQPAGSWRDRVGSVWPAVLLAFLAGTARAANNWTLPALAILLILVSVLRLRGTARFPSPADAAWGALRGAGLVLLSLVLWLPYSASYVLLRPRGNSILASTTMKSGLLEFLMFWGILFAVAAAGLLPSAPAVDEPARRRRDLRIALVVGAAVAASLLTGAPALLVIVPLAYAAAKMAARALSAGAPDPAGVYASFLVLLGLAIIAGCEFVYFKDSYGLELQRMNTVFKFYHQAWPLLGMGAAVFAERAWSDEGGWLRNPARALLAVAIVLALLYPADAALSRLRMHEGAFTLDAFPALARRSPGDAAAISWLSTHALRGSVVLEATGDAYSELARISSHTGIPTVMGWANHEGLWRNNDQEVSDRAALVKVFYGGDERLAMLFCQKYKVTHVVLGDPERRLYPSADSISSYVFLQPVFPEGGRTFPGMTIVYTVHAAPTP